MHYDDVEDYWCSEHHTFKDSCEEKHMQALFHNKEHPLPVDGLLNGFTCEQIAPHKGEELNLVMMGTKPLALIDRCKQPEAFDKVFQLRHVLSYEVVTKDILTVTRKDNDYLHAVFRSLNTSKPTLLVRNIVEKHTLLGRLFGYSDAEIKAFTANKPECNCITCAWDE